MAVPDSPEKSIFLQAIEMNLPAERAAFLDEACQGNPQLRAEVEALLRAHDAPQPVLDTRNPAPPTMDDPISERPGTVIGPYKLLQEIGEGGMGTVFMAEQNQPVQRMVALKIIKPGMDSRQVLARFEAERQALALMDHPNIAKVLDVGKTAAGRPYFVMELVKGVPITKYCDEHRLTPRQRLELFLPVCHAIQHAHQKGIIHRDLKPSNVLVASYDDEPVPKVIDFGVAKAIGQKLTEKTMFTELGQLVGTLEYMSPEQAKLNALDIDTRSDIYSLGVLLYELLTGTTPFEKKRLRSAALDEMLRIIREEEPPKPSTRLSTTEELPAIAARRGLEPKRLSGLLRGELDWIVMKALSKERNRRYETANGFAMDLQRYLHNEPVLAGPPSALYRVRKFVRRNRGHVIAAGLLLLALVGGVIGSTAGLIAARRQEAAAIAERNAKEQALRDEAEQRQAAQASAKEAKTREAETLAVLDFVENKIFAAARPQGQQGGLGKDVSLRRAIDAALPFVDKSFADQPLIDARLRMTLGESFRFLGDYRAAVEQMEKARVLYAKHLGSEHPSTLKTMRSLASSYDQAGRYEEALKLREQTLDLCKARLGANHPETLASMHGLANSYTHAGRHQEALRLYEETMQLRIATLGPDHPDTLESMNGLANSYEDAGRTLEALKLYEKTLQVRKAMLGPDHPDTLLSMNNLAVCYDTVGRTQDALNLREETLQLQKIKLGEDHPATLLSMSNLAASYAGAGRRLDALKLSEETLKLRKAKLGPDHPQTLASMQTLASYYLDAGRTEEALKLGEEAVELWKAKVGPEHRNTLEAVHGLADSYFVAGRTKEALKLDEETLQLRKAMLGPNHPDTLDSMHILAWRYFALGRHADACKLHEETLALRRAKLGPDHPATLSSMSSLAHSYSFLGRPAEALKLRQEVVALRTAKLGPYDPKTIGGMDNLASSYLELGRYAEALKLREEALALSRVRFGENSPKMNGIFNNLSWFLATCPDAKFRDPGRAVELAKKAVELTPMVEMPWNTLGVAQYRAGNWKAAVTALERSIQLRHGGDSFDWFFLTMAHWQLGNKEEARKWYDKSVAWMDKNLPKNDELRRFRAEAEGLLGVKAAAKESLAP